MSHKIVPAIIAENQSSLDEIMLRLEGKANRIMLDVMDGKFVPSNSLLFNPELPEGFEYEAHLMVKEPIYHIDRLAPKINRVIIHAESMNNLVEAISTAKRAGLKVSLALNPDTPVSILNDYLDNIDGVLIMTVVPGGYGGRFIPETLTKIGDIKQLDPSLEVEVDGGMNPVTAKMALKAGADVIASGSYLLGNKNVAEAISELRKI